MSTNDAVHESASGLQYPYNESLGYLVREAFRVLNRHLQVRLASHDVTIGQWPFLRILWEEDGLTQRELSERVGLMEPSAMFNLDGLVSRGYVKRVPNPHDRRKRNIYLTPKGRNLEKVLLRYAREVNDLALAGLDGAQIRQSIIAIIDNLQRAPDAAATGVGQSGRPGRRTGRGGG